MSNILKIIRYISYLGIDSKVSESNTRALILCNRIAVTFSVIMLPFIILLKNSTLAIYSIVLFYLSMIFVLIFNKYKFYNLSRITLSVVPITLFFVIGISSFNSSSIGSSSFYVINLVLSITSLLVFRLKEYKYIIACLLLSVVSCISFNYSNNYLHEYLTPVNIDNKWIIITSYLTAVTILTFGLSYLKNINHESYNRINNLYKLANNKNLELKKKHNTISEQKEELQAIADKLVLINKELEKLSLVASKTDNGVMIFNRNGDLEWINEGSEKLFGKNISEVKQVYQNTVKNIISDKKYSYNQSLVKTKLHNYNTENELWLQSTYTPVLDKHGKPDSFIVINSDVTDIKRIEKELGLQKEELGLQKDIAIKQFKEIESQKHEITASIRYAKRIQEIILPETEFLESVLKNQYFILYNPKDIVSGDFYSFVDIDDKLYISVIDCKGHGVAGAFMSIFSYSLLNHVLYDMKIKDTAKILKSLNEMFKVKLKQQQNFNIEKNSMDISLCCIDKISNTIEYSGANIPIYIARENELLEYVGDSIKIGYSNLDEKHISKETIKLQMNDMIYLFSDGYAEQIGQDSNKKYSESKLKELLISINEKHPTIQKQKLEESHYLWKGNKDQTDDIIIFGIRHS